MAIGPSTPVSNAVQAHFVTPPPPARRPAPTGHPLFRPPTPPRPPVPAGPQTVVNGMTEAQWNAKHPGETAAQNVGSWNNLVTSAQDRIRQQNLAAAQAKQAAADKAAADKAAADKAAADKATQTAANPGLSTVGSYWQIDPTSQQQASAAQTGLQHQIGAGTGFDYTTGMTQNVSAAPSIVDPSKGMNFESMVKNGQLMDVNGNPVDVAAGGQLRGTWDRAVLNDAAQYDLAKASNTDALQQLTNAGGAGGRIFSGESALQNEQQLAKYNGQVQGLKNDVADQTSQYSTGVDDAVNAYNQQMSGIADAATQAAMAKRTADPNYGLGGTYQGPTTPTTATPAATTTPSTAKMSQAQWNAKHPGETAKQNEASYDRYNPASDKAAPARKAITKGKKK